MESAYIDAINANPDDRLPQFVYADWLDEMGDPRGEAWRVLIEAGKRPGHWRANTGYPGWNWDSYYPSDSALNIVELFGFLRLDEDLMQAFPTFHAAMSAAAIAWVRCHRDAEFEPDLLHRGDMDSARPGVCAGHNQPANG